MRMTTVREARAAFFARSGFDESNYEDTWVLLRLGPVPFAFPNTASRKRAVPLHDIHHALTGYDATWRGETSQSAWEIGSGCGRYGAAWAINLGGLALGLVMYPRDTWRAFMRGRSSGNLYADAAPAWQAVLDDDIDALRARLPVTRA
jgi:ubiquinone biosynthesis protein Coq4